MAVDRQCPVERRHLEMMAAQLAAGLLTHRQGRYYGEGGYGALVNDAATIARAIQAEVAEQGATNAELEAVCPVPPFPGIRGGGAGE